MKTGEPSTPHIIGLDDLAAGNSREQQDAEAVMLSLLSTRLGVLLAPARVHLPDGSFVDCDGVSVDPPTLVEAWAHQGPPKGAQRNKVLADALKLAHVSGQLARGHRRVLCFSDPAAAAPFTGKTWYAGAIRSLEIEVFVVELGPEWRARITAAQVRQFR